NIDELPLYPEQRDCARPTAEQILRLFSLAERHQVQDGKVVQTFDVQFTGLQRQVLALLGVPEDAFRLPRESEIHAKLGSRPAESRKGDPATLMAEPGARAEDLARVRNQWGLDRSWPVQYAQFVQNILPRPH